MASPSTLLGKRGESAVSTQLLRPNEKGEALFDPCFLGEKAELLDFIVRLQKDGHPFGPFFFLQVKTTASKREGDSIRAEFSFDEVKRAQALQAPVYVAAVDASDRKAENVYIRPIYASLDSGIASIRTKNPLSDDAKCQELFLEVESHFDRVKVAFGEPVPRTATAPVDGDHDGLIGRVLPHE